MSEGFLFGLFLVRWHSLLMVIGVALGALLSTYETKKRGHDPEIIYYLFLPVLIWGTIGARLWHILTPTRSAVELGLTTRFYFSNPFDMIAFWVGGYGIPGAILGGIFGLFLFARNNQLHFWNLADFLAPGVLLAQIIGRLGDYFNQEIYGLPSKFPWAIFIDLEHRLSGFENVEFYHPLFAYEIVLNFIGLIFILWLSRKYLFKLPSGGLFLMYLVYYSLIRFLLEFLRFDPSLAGNINVNQVFCALVLLVSLTAFFIKRQREVDL